MGELVAHHEPDGAVVHRVVGALRVEGRLQDAGREDDLVHGRVVVGVHGGRAHHPLAAVEGLADLGELAAHLEGRGGAGRGEEGVAAHDEAVVGAPPVRIADLVHHRAELLLGADAGGIVHPGEGVEALPHRPLDPAHQRERLRLGVAGEVPAHEGLSDRLAHEAVGHLDAVLPALRHGLLAGEVPGPEPERLVAQRLRQGAQRGRLREHVPAQVGAPGLGRRAGEELVHADERGRGGGVEGGEAGSPERLEVRLPREARRGLLQTWQVEPVVDAVRVAQLGARPVALGEGGLEREHRLGVGGGLRGWHPGRRELLLDVGREVLADGGALLVRVRVVVPVRQREPGLRDDADHLRRVLGVLLRADVEEREGALGVQAAQGRGQALRILRRIELRPRLAQLGEAGLLDRALVHAGTVEVGDSLPVAVLGVDLAGCGRLQEAAELHLVLLAHDVEGARPARLVGGDLGRLEPAAAGVAVEVHARVHRRVHDGGIDAGRGSRRSGFLRGGRSRRGAGRGTGEQRKRQGKGRAHAPS